MPPAIRPAGPADAAAIGRLHADSWRRHYRGAYADSYLDGDVEADRAAVWSARLAAPTGTRTFAAVDDGDVVGFVHLVLNHDVRWGSLIDNLHVTWDRQRSGIGRRLLSAAAAAAADARTAALYLWVLEQNEAAQRFYRAAGATCVESAEVGPPGGVPGRLVGQPVKLRMVWPDATVLAG
jgi:ribosomal protein S18 acetylase RimI-like enzyme